MARIFSGIQPTGDLHIGNYLGAIRQWVREQNPDALYCVVDLHALTVDVDPEELHRSTLEVVVGLLAAGLDPEVCTMFVQSHVAEHTRLCVAPRVHRDLRRAAPDDPVQGQVRAQRGRPRRAAHLPGADGGGHLALRHRARPGGRRPAPAPRAHPGGRRAVQQPLRRDLRRPEGPGPQGRRARHGPPGPRRRRCRSPRPPRRAPCSCSTTPDAIARKVRRAVTDTDGEVRYDPATKPGVSNLLEILASLTDEDPRAVADAVLGLRAAEGRRRRGARRGARADPRAARRARSPTPRGSRRCSRAGAERAQAMASVKYAQAAAAMGLLAPCSSAVARWRSASASRGSCTRRSTRRSVCSDDDERRTRSAACRAGSRGTGPTTSSAGAARPPSCRRAAGPGCRLKHASRMLMKPEAATAG